ncbi:MAG TPA: GNAT family N-acetyltransferase [Candidatus Limnocylindria bacterium]|nr:GNAT family N-acetyltransferase [Candidatus Limnocylindria bacterium]
MRSDEWESLRRLRLRALADAPHAFTTTRADAERRSDDEWREAGRRGADGDRWATFVAEGDQQLVGMATGSVSADDSFVSLFQMWVGPEARRSGVGGRLVRAVLEWAAGRGCSLVRLDVNFTDAGAVAFYTSLGFRDTGRRGQLRPGSDVPTMEMEASTAARLPRETRALTEKIHASARVLFLYGTTPPRIGTPDHLVQAVADKLATRLRELPVDGVVVYDIQDESGRTQLPRPFAFTGTIDPRSYSRLIVTSAGLPTITYKSLGDLEEERWLAWLDETANVYGAGCLSIVGRPTSGVRYPLALSTAIRLAAAHPAGFTVGGVAIAERHSEQRSESARMLAKSIDGCSYFISQTVYHADATERLLAYYVRDCRDAGVPARRIVLTFAPAGRAKTLTFLKWLGVHIPEKTEATILGATDPIARSIEICRENLRRILDHEYSREIPLGVNVESVSINRDEIDASVELFHSLSEVLREWRGRA